MRVAEGCVRLAIMVGQVNYESSQRLCMEPGHQAPPPHAAKAKPRDVIGFPCLSVLTLCPPIHRTKKWIKSMQAYWKRNGPQSSDYRKRFVPLLSLLLLLFRTRVARAQPLVVIKPIEIMWKPQSIM